MQALSLTQQKRPQSSMNMPSPALPHRQGLPIPLQRFSALLGLLILSPILILLVLMIRLESRGNPIFKQTRIGINGKPFIFYKLRSMYTPEDKRFKAPNPKHSDREGVCHKYRNDPRVTNIGRIIRKLSLDELPQLINVLKGDMLLVGPRPALSSEAKMYDAKAQTRLMVTPGITGLWQISGRADTTFNEQIDLDIRYIEERSWITDFRILLATVPAIISGKGAY